MSTNSSRIKLLQQQQHQQPPLPTTSSWVASSLESVKQTPPLAATSALSNQGNLLPASNPSHSRFSSISESRAYYETMLDEKNRLYDTCIQLEVALEKEREHVDYLQQKMKVVIAENDRLIDMTHQQPYQFDNRIVEDLEHRCYDLLTENQKLQALVNQERIAGLEANQRFAFQDAELRDFNIERTSLLSENEQLVRALETFQMESSYKDAELSKLSDDLHRLQAGNSCADEMQEQIRDNLMLLEEQQRQIQLQKIRMEELEVLSARQADEIKVGRDEIAQLKRLLADTVRRLEEVRQFQLHSEVEDQMHHYQQSQQSSGAKLRYYDSISGMRQQQRSASKMAERKDLQDKLKNLEAQLENVDHRVDQIVSQFGLQHAQTNNGYFYQTIRQVGKQSVAHRRLGSVG